MFQETKSAHVSTFLGQPFLDVDQSMIREICPGSKRVFESLSGCRIAQSFA